MSQSTEFYNPTSQSNDVLASPGQTTIKWVQQGAANPM
jgi:hypothetical protein